MTGATVIRRPHWRKEIQCVMNRQQSTSTPRNDYPENHKGEGSTPGLRHPCAELGGIRANRSRQREAAKTGAPLASLISEAHSLRTAPATPAGIGT